MASWGGRVSDPHHEGSAPETDHQRAKGEVAAPAQPSWAAASSPEKEIVIFRKKFYHGQKSRSEIAIVGRYVPTVDNSKTDRHFKVSSKSVILLIMRDPDVRQVLKERLNTCYGAGAMIVEELGLCRGTVRADIAVVDSSLKGYEIKSERDTLARLPNQANVYSKVFDTVTIVVSDQHLNAAACMIPAWWGIQIATSSAASLVQLATIRKEEENPTVDPLALAELLWRDEVLMLLAQLSRAKKLTYEPRRVLWQTLVAAIPLYELKHVVRDCLKNRTGWRADKERMQGGERSQLYATSSGSLHLRVLARNRRYTNRPS